MSVVTDEDRHYRYFEGEVSGISVDVEVATTSADYYLYDFHYSIPLFHLDNLLLVTNYEKKSLDRLDGLITQVNDVLPSGVLIVQSPSKVSIDYVEKSIPIEVPSIVYEDDTYRRIDWVHDGRINFRSVEKGFRLAVEDYLKIGYDIPNKDLAKLWAYARKRG